MTGSTRREVLATATVLVLAPRCSRGYAAHDALNLAGIGVGGRGHSHVESTIREGQNLVAACDAAEGSLNHCLRYAQKNAKDRPLPRTFQDYREMFAKMEKEIDAVFVATPDHHHAPATMMALQRKKHVYCEKPLTHNIAEARRLAEAARQKRVATQMGNQGRAGDGWRLLCEYLWAGLLGTVKEVHIWTDRPGIPGRPWWPQGAARPAGADPVPAGLNWDVWLGPAPERPYLDTWKEGRWKGQKVYHPFVWRGWWDFGTGALGDIGCHAMSGTFTALRIEHASSVELVKDSGDGTADMPPCASIIRWDIPARGDMPPCRLFWYDGGFYPPRELLALPEGKPFPGNGRLLVSDKGVFGYSGDGGPPRPLEGQRTLPPPPPQSFPRCESNHFAEWLTACKGGRPAFSNFDHAGPLTEFVLLGHLAVRAGVGRKVEWDGRTMRVKNIPELNAFVSRTPRKGWEA